VAQSWEFPASPNICLSRMYVSAKLLLLLMQSISHSRHLRLHFRRQLPGTVRLTDLVRKDYQIY
jgi:hypothetical protein